MMLDDLGLIPTVKRYVDAVKSQAGMEIDLVVTGNERRLEPYIEVVVFRSFQELLNNAINDSQSPDVKVFMDVPENEVRLSVEDSGKGFVLSDVLASDKHVGLKLIKERAEMLGGTFDVDSSPEGSRISILLPIVKTGTIG